MQTIALANHKGGVGKSATTYALGDALSGRGFSVLMVDCDPQSSLTSACGIKDTAGVNLATAMAGEFSLADTLFEIKNNLDVAPADITLSQLELALVNEPGREDFLKRLLATVAGDYDLCLIDCPPSLGLLTVNALSAADAVLIPSQPQIADIRGLNLFLETLAKILHGSDDGEAINPNLEVLGILPTFYDNRLIHHAEALEAMKEAGWPVLDYRIGRSVRVAEAFGVGQSIVSYEPSNARAKEYIEFSGYVEKWLREKKEPTLNKGELTKDPLVKTTTSPRAEDGKLPEDGRTVPIGVGLKEPEVEALDAIAEKYKVSRHSLMRYAIRHFIKEVWAGRIKLGEDVEEPETKNKLNMP